MKVYVLSRLEYCHECAGMDIGTRVYADLDEAKAVAQEAYANMRARGKYKNEPETLTWKPPEAWKEYFDLEDTYYSGAVETGAVFHGTTSYSDFNIMEYEVL